MSEPATTISGLAGLRLLIIEDEPMLALCVEDIAASAGCVVVGVAATVADALAKIDVLQFDVALLDLHLHGQSVEDVSAAIQRRGANAVIATGSEVSAVPIELRRWPILRKPYKDHELLAALAPIAATI